MSKEEAKAILLRLDEEKRRKYLELELKFNKNEEPFFYIPKEESYANVVQSIRGSYARDPEANRLHKYLVRNGKMGRLFTFYENWVARVKDFKKRTGNLEFKDKNIEEMIKLWQGVSDDLEYKYNRHEDSSLHSNLTTCTSIVYQKGTSKFKIRDQCGFLILSVEADDKYKKSMLMDYDFFSGEGSMDGVFPAYEFDIKEDKYNEPLTKEEFFNHKLLNKLLHENEYLMRDIAFIVYDVLGNKELMNYYYKKSHYEQRKICPDELNTGKAFNFWIKKKSDEEEGLRPITMGKYLNSFTCSGIGNLFNNCRYLNITLSKND